MRNYGRGFTLAIVFATITLGLTVGAQQDLTPENDVPVLDLKQAEKTGSDQLKGRKRSQSLRQSIRIEELPAGVEPLPTNIHVWQHLAALPVEESNAIVLGKVTDRRAVLIDDKFGIYSEFSIRISEILKDDLNGFSPDQMISTSRPGGAVLFPSGKIQQYTIAGQGYPQQDKAYVLFLKRDEPGDYSILTGYEVTGGVVQPLDGKRNLAKNEPDTQFGIFRGVTLESFRTALKKAL